METGYKALDYIIHYNFYFAAGVYIYYYKHLVTGKIWTAKSKPVFILSFVVIFIMMVVTKYIFDDINYITELLYLFQVLLNVLFNYSCVEVTNKFIWVLGVVFALICSYGLYFIAERPSKNLLNNLRKNKA